MQLLVASCVWLWLQSQKFQGSKGPVLDWFMPKKAKKTGLDWTLKQALTYSSNIKVHFHSMIPKTSLSVEGGCACSSYVLHPTHLLASMNMFACLWTCWHGQKYCSTCRCVGLVANVLTWPGMCCLYDVLVCMYCHYAGTRVVVVVAALWLWRKRKEKRLTCWSSCHIYWRHNAVAVAIVGMWCCDCKENKNKNKEKKKEEVCDQASPNHSRETDESSGIDLMQKERRSNECQVGNWLDAKEGWRSIGSGMHWWDARESEGLGVHCLRCELAWDRATGFGIGKACLEMVLKTWEWHRQVGIGWTG